MSRYFRTLGRYAAAAMVLAFAAQELRAGNPNDECAGAIQALAGPTVGDNLAALGAEIDPSCTTSGAKDVWYFYTATSSGSVLIDMCGTYDMSGFDAVLAAYAACGGAELACDDDCSSFSGDPPAPCRSRGSGLDSCICVYLTQGETIYLQVLEYGGDTGSFVMNIRPGGCTLTVGGCCVGTNCSVTAPDQCTSMGGAYLGNGVTCTGSPCTQGACCDVSNGSCMNTSSEACAAAGRLFIGGATNCASQQCPSPGDDCNNPGHVTDAFTMIGQYTCARGNDYGDTCLDNYDSGEDMIIEWTVTQNLCVNLNLNPGPTDYSGFAVHDACPPASSNCIATSSTSDSVPHSIRGLSLAPGMYYIMVDTFASPNCIPRFDMSATACPRGSCCVTGVCSILAQVDCTAAGGNYLGDNTTCTVNVCTFGACCLPDAGGCVEMSEENCDRAGGLFLGGGSICVPNPCPLPGANCLIPLAVNVPADLPLNRFGTTCNLVNDYENTCLDSYDGGEDALYELNVTEPSCLNISVSSGTGSIGCVLDDACPPGATDCLAMAASGDNPDVIDGVALAAGTYYLMVDTSPSPNCSSYTLDVSVCPTGACCMEDDCVVTSQSECNAAAGAYLGNSSVCSPNPCVIGACCTPSGCRVVSGDECAQAGGTYQGGATDCDPNPCPPLNDLCENATVITVGQLPFLEEDVRIAQATGDRDISCNASGASETRFGVWYRFTATSDCTGIIRVRGSNDSLDSVTAVFTGPDCGNLTQVACSDPENLTLPMVSGQTYWVLAGYWSDASTPSDTIDVLIDCQPAPANDRCAGAEAISCGTNLTNISNFAAANDYAPSGFGCQSTIAAGPDLVYRLDLTLNCEVRVNVSDTTFDPVLYVMPDCNQQGGCVGSVDDGGTGSPETLTFQGLTGRTYYIIVDSYGAAGLGFFDLSVDCTCDAPEVDCPGGDLNDDGEFDGRDLPMILNVLRGSDTTATSICRTDVDGDDNLDQDDLALLIRALLSPPETATAYFNTRLRGCGEVRWAIVKTRTRARTVIVRASRDNVPSACPVRIIQHSLPSDIPITGTQCIIPPGTTVKVPMAANRKLVVSGEAGAGSSRISYNRRVLLPQAGEQTCP